MLHRGDVDLVVLESQLPDGSGLSLLAEVARDLPALPSVMMTGHGSETICALAFKLGVKDYLRKPVERAVLLAALRPLLLPRPVLHRGLRPRRVPRAGARMRMQQRIRDAVRFLHDHHAEPLTLAEVAQTVGVSKFTLSHGFSATMRVSFRAYLVRVRVVRATELLRRSSHSVIEISEMVGFGDLSRFNKAFKKYVGLPPTAYRRVVVPPTTVTALIADRDDMSA